MGVQVPPIALNFNQRFIMQVCRDSIYLPSIGNRSVEDAVNERLMQIKVHAEDIINIQTENDLYIVVWYRK